MKLHEQVRMLKKDLLNYLIIVKSGSFYVSYNDDAYILHDLFSYQLQDEKVGFPLNSLDKILEKLQEEHINVYLVNENIKHEYYDNRYQEKLYISKKNYFNELNTKVLLEEIEFLLKNNPENIIKFKDFINEL